MTRSIFGTRVSRRVAILRLTALASAAALAQACQQAAPPAQPPATTAQKPAAQQPTQQSAGSAAPTAAPAVATNKGPSGELRIAYGGFGPDRHPQSPTVVPDQDIVKLYSDPLLALANDGSIEPGIAMSYEQVSETRYRLRLRPLVKFHDGSPLTATDVKFSLESYLKSKNAEQYNVWLDRVDVIDDTTAEAVAKMPYRVAMSNTAYKSFIIPRTAGDPKDFAQKPIGSGPYKFSQSIPNDRVIVTANTDYWGAPPKFEQITVRQIAEDATRMAALEAGEVDFATNVPVDAVDRLKKQGIQVTAVASNRMMFVRFNFAVDGPWKDVRVRQALNHAVDRAALSKALLSDLGVLAEAPLGHGVAYYKKGLPQYNYDPARAKQLLAEAGFPNGFQSTLVTPTGRYMKDRESAEAVAGQLEAVGVKIQLQPMEWGTYLQEIFTDKATSGKKYPMSLMAWGNPPMDPEFGLRGFNVGQPWNVGFYQQDEVEALSKEGLQTFDTSKLNEIYGKIQEIIWRDAPWIFMYELPNIVAHSPKFQGYQGRLDEMIRWETVSRVA